MSEGRVKNNPGRNPILGNTLGELIIFCMGIVTANEHDVRPEKLFEGSFLNIHRQLLNYLSFHSSTSVECPADARHDKMRGAGAVHSSSERPHPDSTPPNTSSTKGSLSYSEPSGIPTPCDMRKVKSLVFLMRL